MHRSEVTTLTAGRGSGTAYCIQFSFTTVFSLSQTQPGFPPFVTCSVSSLCIFTSIFILLTNAVSDPEHLGGMNGIAASAAAVSRAVGPTVGGSVFAWSVGQHGIFPLDYHLAFVSTGAILTATLVVSILLPNTINERKFVTG